MKKLAMLTVAAATLFVGAGVADAYPPYPPGAATVAVSDSTPAAGGTVTATVSGCTPGQAVTFELDGDTEVVVCDASGKAAADLQVPTTAAAYTGSATLGLDVSLSFDIVVAAVSDTIPQTGNAGTGKTGVAALGFLVLGAGLVFGTRRRSANRLS